VHPKVLIDDLLRQTKETKSQTPGFQTDLFADFNGMPKGADKTEFYAHDQNWSNRMILGDSLQVMASLAEREGLRGKVAALRSRLRCYWPALARRSLMKWRRSSRA
jgi:adenine-specific DNA-methyltransferase